MTRYTYKGCNVTDEHASFSENHIRYTKITNFKAGFYNLEIMLNTNDLNIRGLSSKQARRLQNFIKFPNKYNKRMCLGRYYPLGILQFILIIKHLTPKRVNNV